MSVRPYSLRALICESGPCCLLSWQTKALEVIITFRWKCGSLPGGDPPISMCCGVVSVYSRWQDDPKSRVVVVRFPDS